MCSSASSALSSSSSFIRPAGTRHSASGAGESGLFQSIFSNSHHRAPRTMPGRTTVRASNLDANFVRGFEVEFSTSRSNCLASSSVRTAGCRPLVAIGLSALPTLAAGSIPTIPSPIPKQNTAEIRWRKILTVWRAPRCSTLRRRARTIRASISVIGSRPICGKISLRKACSTFLAWRGDQRASWDSCQSIATRSNVICAASTAAFFFLRYSTAGSRNSRRSERARSRSLRAWIRVTSG
jgi:hypothetical protein